MNDRPDPTPPNATPSGDPTGDDDPPASGDSTVHEDPIDDEDPTVHDEPTTPEGHRKGTITFPIVDGAVLLIYKKTGLGADRYNGPGGKLEPGESPKACAIRETVEEVRATPRELAKVGEIDFRFGEKPINYLHVFRADGLDGTPAETREARPEWVPSEEVPYEEMWEGDRYWLPHVLERTRFRGTVRYDDDGEELLDHEFETDVQL